MLPERFYLAGAEILVGADLDETIRIAAGQFAALARKLSVEGRTFNVALSGGSTPRRLFQALAAEPFAAIVPWRSIHFFWGDERNVPPSDPDSNYRTAHELLLSRVPVPPANVHRIPTGDGTAVEAADGHTASLFPHRPTLHEQQRLVVADHVEELNSWRVTLTAPILNNAAQITFLVTGEDKAAVVRQVIQGSRDIESTPAQLIAPRDGALTWILDTAAASQLARPAAAP
jgi:6-phosphogluconolactonase